MRQVRRSMKCLAWVGAAACAVGCSKTGEAPVSKDWKLSGSVVHEVSGADIVDCFLDSRGLTILTRNPGRDVNTLLRLDHGEPTPRVLATFAGGLPKLVSPTAAAFPRDKSLWLITPPYTREHEVARFDSDRIITEGFGDHCLVIGGLEATPGHFGLHAIVVENASGKIVAREALQSGTPRAAALTSDAAIAYGRLPDQGEHDITFQRASDGEFTVARREVAAELVGNVRVAIRSDGVPITSPPTNHGFRIEKVTIDGTGLRLPEQLMIGREWTMHDDILIYPGDRSLILVDTRLKQVTHIPTLTVYPPETKIGLGRSEVPDQLPIWGRQQIHIMERAP